MFGAGIGTLVVAADAEKKRQETAFWDECFLIQLRAGVDPGSAAKNADHALMSRRQALGNPYNHR